MSPRNKILLSFLAIYVIWGSTFLSIRIGVRDFPPILFAGFRFLIAGALLSLVVLKFEKRRFGREDHRVALISGLLLFAGGNGLLTWAQQHMSSGLTSLWPALVPAWVLVLNAFAFEKKRPGNFAIAGALLGVPGALLLAKEGAQTGGIGANLALLASTLAWTLGTLIQRGHLTKIPTPTAFSLGFAAHQMIYAGILLTVIGVGAGEITTLVLSPPSAKAFAALGYLIVFGSVIAFSAYTYLVNVVPTYLVATYSFVNPIIALALGAFFLNETLTSRTLLASALILTAVGLIWFERVRAKR